MRVQNILSTLLATSISTAAAFGRSCRSCNYAIPSYMICMECDRIDGSHNAQASIDLADCFGNDDGHLEPMRNGRFHTRCRDIFINDLYIADFPSRQLVAECETIDGRWLPNAVLLEDVMVNDDGNLRCEF